MKTSRLLSAALSVLTALAVLTGSVAVPLLCRSFYYAHIGPMGLEDYGLSRVEIERAYDEMMDFCLGRRADFSAGALAFSQSGADHFADVRGLFLLDLRVLAGTLILLAAALDFDRAFVVFHSVFFPGKDNWIFDWRTDPIILLLPQDFFRNCAILILALLLAWCAALIGADLWLGRRREQRNSRTL